MLGIVPVDFKKPYDVREVIARLVDDSDFFEFKALYGSATVCGHAQIEGHAVGILGNNGPINPDGATKAGQFIQLCCQSGTPWCSCRTRPATWSAPRPSGPAWSSTARR
nr:carboxyl transferase domain-containing protein [Nannocystis pusilla]